MVIIFGLLVVGVGLFWIQRPLRLRTKGFSAIGTVTETGRLGNLRHLVVSFKPYNKKSVVFHADAFTPTMKVYRVGDSIPVLYDPYKPTNAIIYAFEAMYLLPLSLVGFGLLIVYQGFAH